MSEISIEKFIGGGMGGMFDEVEVIVTCMVNDLVLTRNGCQGI
jgi:hypothetical protein